MIPLTLTVPLTHGSVTLRAWGAHHADALLLDLTLVSATLGELRGGQYPDARVRDVERQVWAAWHRLVVLSLDGEAQLPPTTFGERLQLLDALWQLNDVEAIEGKLNGLIERAQRAMTRHMQTLGQPRLTTRSTSS